MEIIPIKSPLIKLKDDLFEVFLHSVKRLRILPAENSIIVIASKVVSMSEGRVIDLRKIKPSKRARSLRLRRYGSYAPDPRFTELVLREADKFWPSEMFLTIKDGIFAPSAGIDTSNAPKNHAILWPADAYASAEKFLKKLKTRFHLRHAGVIIADSFIAPLRQGVTSIAIGYAGFEGVQDLRGRRDLYKNRLHSTQKNLADSLATAASIFMGEADERTPFVIIKNAPVKFTDKKISPKEIKTPAKKCLFRVLYK
ncbi:coenzyme F420-0:L-glutamate ligase [Candidatus Peregrinibacteria bacterium]|nr:coenzyme F420-0:L-glutamate ligase [Candidatus Peregrinibacteria bacterium]